ncbi:lysylphosphatidylglycerol synthase transmembrane domain-containing protein [Bacillus sp. B190/17]|uniref:Phosphatidylglycerol lysyltransferase n=1 Tax=Bacillus lumedeiriae TaxID=3058829 RepID=A0ABW8ICZ3_9BACI
MKRFYKKSAKRFISLVIIVAFIVLTIMYFDVGEIWRAVQLLLQNPFWLFVMLSLYFISFCLKAAAWKFYLRKRVSFLSCLLGILYSLFINHLFPIKIGDVIRAEILHKREKLIKREEAFHSVIVLRVMDMGCLIGIAFVGLFVLDIAYKIPVWLIVSGCTIVLLSLLVIKRYFAEFLNRQIIWLKSALFGVNGFVIFLATLLSWIIEAGVLFGTVHILQENATILELAFVNSLTIAGQVFQVTPGGIANYESVMIFGLSLVGIPLKSAYIMAVLNHGIKFFFSYAAGAFCLWAHPIDLDTIRNWTKLRGVRGK